MPRNLALLILIFLIAIFIMTFNQMADSLSEPPSKLLVGHQNAVLAVAFDSTGKLIASAGGGNLKSGDNSIRIWDALSGQQIKILEGHSARIFSIAFSPDGKSLASASQDGTIKIWDIDAGVELRRLIGHNGIVYSINFSLDGQTLVSGSADKTIRLWEVASGRELSIFIGHSDEVFSVAFSPLEDSIASGSQDRTLRIWSLRTGKEIKRYNGYKDNVWSVAYSPDGQLLASASWDGSVRVWDVFSSQEIISVSNLGLLSPASVKFNRDGKLLAVGLFDGSNTVKIWKVSDGKEVSRFDSRPNASLAFSPDGKRLAAGALDGSVKLWETKAEPPDLISPLDNASLDGKAVILQWRTSISALYYDLQISKNRDFTELIYAQNFLTKESLTYEAPPNQRLWWRVRSIGFGTSGDWSPSRSFTLGTPDESVCVIKVQIPNPKISVGESLVVNAIAENVKNVAGFQLDLLFNPKILQAKEIKEGNLLNADGSSTFLNKPTIDNLQGIISGIVAIRLGAEGISGSGIMASVLFSSTGAGDSEFIIKNLKLSSPQGAPISCIETQGGIATIEGTTPPWDVNGDGVVDLFDFVLVGQYVGKKAPTGLEFNPDVNRDENVDILDFVLVGTHFGEKYPLKSPAPFISTTSTANANSDYPNYPNYPNYSQYLPLLLEMLKQLQSTPSSPPIEHTKRVLSDLLYNIQNKNQIPPESNKLLQNYPNPFNPETWIPYQLAIDSEVKIYIFDSFGRAIRTLDLGFKRSGFYISTDAAPRWNGKDKNGDPVSSGVYFYSIQAGKFNSIRKMVILK